VADIAGTTGTDFLVGTNDDDHLQGLDGDDSLDGGLGDDLVEGGEGNDYIVSRSGFDTLDGGAGDDRIEADNRDSAAGTIVVAAGDGNDHVQLLSFGEHAFRADLGAGDDVAEIVGLRYGGSAELTLGAGSDTVSFGAFYGGTQSDLTATVVIKDFEAGAAGDRIDWLNLLTEILVGWDGASNPFATGHVRLVQNGANALLQIDRDGAGSGYSFTTFVVLENLQASSLVWQNLDGFPTDGTIPSNVSLTGTDGPDTLVGSGGADSIEGLDGRDDIWGGTGDDLVHAGGGMDFVYGELGADRLFGEAGDDMLDGGLGSDQLIGGDGDDYLYDLDGQDVLDGGAGNDRITLRRGSLHADLVTGIGGDGDDIFYVQSVGASQFVADLGAGNDRFSVDYLAGTANLTLGAGIDTILLGGLQRTYLINSGSIVVADFQAGAGGDVLDLGDFFPNGGGANPFGNGLLRLVQQGSDTLVQTGEAGWRTIIRFAGVDAAMLTAANFGGFSPDGAPPPGVTFEGTDGFDDFTGGAGADTIHGNGDHDYLHGGAGNDTIDGGAGDDYLYGDSGNDQVSGGDGDDNILDEAGNDVLRGDAGNDTIVSNAGDDLIFGGDGDDAIVIQRFAETGSGSVAFDAGAGNDRVTLSQYGNSYFTGTLGAGDDRLILGGHIGTSLLALGSGADTVDFANVQYGWTRLGSDVTISDLNLAEGDRLDLSQFVLSQFKGWDGVANPFTAGYLRLVQTGADARLEFDDDAGGDDPFILLATFKNVGANLFSEANLGYAPPVVYGTTGNDVFVVDDASDQIVDAGGVDQVRTSLTSYVLPVGLEQLVYIGAGAADLRGNAGDNAIEAGAGNDFIRLQDGGMDEVYAGPGNDAIYFGAAFTPFDRVNGAEGKDVVALQGNYTNGTVFSPENLNNIETLSLLSHSDNRFGGGSATGYSYVLSTIDSTLQAGTQLIVNASTLEAGENLTFDGHLETDGSFFIYAGQGADDLKGGAGADVFFFGENGRFGASDHVDGGAGTDILVLRGDYQIVMSGQSMTHIETVTLMSGADARFAPAGTPFHYGITTAEDTVAAGATMTFNGGGLGSAETLRFDGSAEQDGGAFRIFGGNGNDTITGGAGADLIFGGLGADVLKGGAGNDVFRYQAAGESTAAAMDQILDFASGDRIDLSRAGHFTFIDGAFGGHAGELRVENLSDNVWSVQADLDGDGHADFTLSVTVADNHALTGSDFVF
jgi:Ca2+-binding RTX toxin-like protein